MAEVKRTANFTSKEESILLCLARKYKAILENKKTDSNINKQKIQCWKEIETQVNNETAHIFRDSLTLKKKYENLKKRAKKKLADEKCYALGTGGGPLKKPPEITDIDMEIQEILGERMDGLPSEFGGDAELITIISEDVDETCFVNDGVEETNDDLANNEKSRTITKLDWSKSTVQNLKTPTYKILSVGETSSGKRKRNEYDAMCKKVSHWAASKADLESEKVRFAKEEHERKLEILQKKCDTECEVMRKEADAKIKKIEREAQVTMDGIIEREKLQREILLLEKHIMLQKIKKSSKHDDQ